MRLAVLIIWLSAAALVFPGCAGSPKPAQKDPQTIFNTFDLNRDGRISRNEMLSQTRNRETGEIIFTELDANGDGYVSRDEAAAPGSRLPEAFKLTVPPWAE